MLLQRGHLAERLATLSARILDARMMGVQMHFQLALLLEPLRTVHTLERRLAGVRQHVLAQIRLATELAAAVRTRYRVAVVRRHVIAQRRVAGKRFGAHRALVRSFAGVDAHVALERAGRSEHGAAHVAAIADGRPGGRVPLFVVQREDAFGGEGFILEGRGRNRLRCAERRIEQWKGRIRTTRVANEIAFARVDSRVNPETHLALEAFAAVGTHETRDTTHKYYQN